MLSERNRLLLLLVLLLVVAAAGWTTALAGGKTDSPRVFSSLANASRPPVGPASGEPDVGQTPRVEPTTSLMPLAPRGENGSSQGSLADAWFRWIIRRMWEIRHLGAR